MPLYTQDDLHRAISEAITSKSIRPIAKKWGIPFATLQGRLNGRENRSIAAEGQQRLPKAQEDHLVNWILVQEGLGVPVTHAQIKEFAQRILALKGDFIPLGKRWIQAFFRRNPNIRTKRARNIDSQRINGATVPIIKTWFQHLSLPQVQPIKPENRYNMDESGIMEGLGVNGLVVGSTERRGIQKKQPGSRSWTSFIECISASGRALPPLVIFKGKSTQQQWFPTDLSEYDQWQFTATENAWTTDNTAVEWLEKVFLPNTATSEPRLLILDGHGSHETDDFMWTCYRNNVYLLFLPPHTSHVLQPLDLSVFSALKNAYRQEVGTLTLLTDSSPLGKRNFLACYQKARKEALIAKNIKSGWRASGLWPKSMAKPLMSPLLLENSNPISIPKETPYRDTETLIKGFGIDSNSPLIWSTPKKSTELRAQAAEFQKLQGLQDQSSHAQRLLFRKVLKGFEVQEGILADYELKIQSLEAQLEKARPMKRRKVKTSPNSKFADIRAIQRAQKEAGRSEIDGEAIEIASQSDSTEDCIEVQ